MNKKKKSNLGKFFLGLSLGAGLGVLFAPKKGSETRKDLKNKMDELLVKAKEIDMEDVKFNIENKVFEIKEELSDLDREKVIEIARVKASEIEARCEELVTLAKDKTTPVVKELTEDVRKKAIIFTKEVLKKLEKNEKEN